MNVKIGVCPTCGAPLGQRAETCVKCGENDFMVVERHRQQDEPCFDCANGLCLTRPCPRCHDFRIVVIYTAQRIDVRTGKRTSKVRREARIDEWNVVPEGAPRLDT